MTITVHCAHDEMVEIARVIQNPRNPNTHPVSQIDALAKIISAQGWRAPIGMSRRSGFIVRGHGRYQAALKLGCTHVPVDWQDYESDAAEWADMIADNRIAELAQIDDVKLNDLMADLKMAEFDVDLTGFDDTFFSSESEKAENDAESIKREKNAICVCPQCQFEFEAVVIKK